MISFVAISNSAALTSLSVIVLEQLRCLCSWWCRGPYSRPICYSRVTRLSSLLDFLVLLGRKLVPSDQRRRRTHSCSLYARVDKYVRHATL